MQSCATEQPTRRHSKSCSKHQKQGVSNFDKALLRENSGQESLVIFGPLSFFLGAGNIGSWPTALGPGASKGSSANIFLDKTSMSQNSRKESSEPPAKVLGSKRWSGIVPHEGPRNRETCVSKWSSYMGPELRLNCGPAHVRKLKAPKGFSDDKDGNPA